MATVNYKGKSTLFINGYKIVPGANDIPDDDFNTMMQSKTFKARVQQNILEVKGGLPAEKKEPAKTFPPVKPMSSGNKGVLKQPASEQRQAPVPQERHSEEPVKQERHSEHELSSSLRDTLSEIELSEDKVFLKELIDSDERQKVVDAAKKRLKTLKGH